MSLLLKCLIFFGLCGFGLCQTCPGINCWDQCFSDPPAALETAYFEIFQMVNSLRSGRAFTFNVSSTTFFMDGSYNNAGEHTYQRLLAAIAAYTLPVDSTCNRFFLINYGQVNFFPVFNGCMSRCQAAQLLFSMPFSQNAPMYNFDPLGFACFVAETMYPQAVCPAGDTRLGVAFMNSDAQTYAPFVNPSDMDVGFCRKFAVKASVKIGSFASPLPRFETNTDLGLQTTMTTDRFNAAGQIFQCISQSCTCPPLTKRRRKRSTETEEDPMGTLYYSSVSDPFSMSQVDNVKLSDMGTKAKEIEDQIMGTSSTSSSTTTTTTTTTVPTTTSSAGNVLTNCNECLPTRCADNDFKQACIAQCGRCIFNFAF